VVLDGSDREHDQRTLAVAACVFLDRDTCGRLGQVAEVADQLVMLNMPFANLEAQLTWWRRDGGIEVNIGR